MDYYGVTRLESFDCFFFFYNRSYNRAKKKRARKTFVVVLEL